MQVCNRWSNQIHTVVHKFPCLEFSNIQSTSSILCEIHLFIITFIFMITKWAFSYAFGTISKIEKQEWCTSVTLLIFFVMNQTLHTEQYTISIMSFNTYILQELINFNFVINITWCTPTLINKEVFSRMSLLPWTARLLYPPQPQCFQPSSNLHTY